MGLLDESAGNHGAVLEHILQIHQVTVVHMLGVIVGVMEVDDARLVGLHDLPGQQDPAGDVLADLACHVVPLDGVDGGVFVGVLLLDLLVVALDEAEDPIVSSVGLAEQAPGVAVGDILLGHLKGAMGHDGLFHQVLDLLHGGAAAHFLTGDLDGLGNAGDLQGGHPDLLLHRPIGLRHRHDNFINIKNLFGSVTLDDLHIVSSLL